MLYSDLRELKSVLEIDPKNTQEDKNLLFFLEQTSQWIEEYLNRPGLSYSYRTEFYQGTGTQKLLLRSRPVFTTPAIQVLFDDGGNWGSTSGSFNPGTQALTYGVDFCLQIDQSDGTSRSGILYRINDLWFKPQVRQAGLLSPFIGPDLGSFQITYMAGYTVDTLPAAFRLATNQLVAEMRNLFPLGVGLGSESYEERSVSYLNDRKSYFMGMVADKLNLYRNWKY